MGLNSWKEDSRYFTAKMIQEVADRWGDASSLVHPTCKSRREVPARRVLHAIFREPWRRLRYLDTTAGPVPEFQY